MLAVQQLLKLQGDMMTALKLIQIGNSVGVILPKEVLSRLKLGREFMRDYRETFHHLAK